MWKAIKGYEDSYAVDQDGRVKSNCIKIIDTLGHEYYKKERILKPNVSVNGYLMVHLCKNGVRTGKYIHRLVAESFIPNPNNYTVVNHLDGNKANCKVNNLEWTTYSQNNQHAYDNGLHKSGTKHYKAKLNENLVKEIRKNGKYTDYQSIAKKYGVTKATIRDVLLNKTWRRVI